MDLAFDLPIQCRDEKFSQNLLSIEDRQALIEMNDPSREEQDPPQAPPGSPGAMWERTLASHLS